MEEKDFKNYEIEEWVDYYSNQIPSVHANKFEELENMPKSYKSSSS